MSEPEAQPSPETYPAGKTKYFVKEIASNPVNVRLPQPDGTFLIARVPFEDFGDDTGFLAIDDPTKIVAIRNLIRSRRGGIREVGKEEFEDAKVASVQEQRRALLRPNGCSINPSGQTSKATVLWEGIAPDLPRSSRTLPFHPRWFRPRSRSLRRQRWRPARRSPGGSRPLRRRQNRLP